MKTTPALRSSSPGAIPDAPAGLPNSRSSSLALRLTVEVPGDTSAVRIAEPVTLGVPLPSGACIDERLIGVSGGAGSIPVQADVLERWPDGSIRWALLDFQANAPASYDVSFTNAAVPPLDGLTIREHGDHAEVDAGGLTFSARTSGEFQLDVRRPGDIASIRTVGIDLTRRDETVVRPQVTTIVWETKGPLRSVLRVDASVATESGALLAFVVRLHFYARLPTVRFEVTLSNPSRAQHPGGFWELGDAGSILIRDCSVRVDTASAPVIRCSVEPNQSPEPVAVPFELYQDSSGGENWQSPVHVNRDGVVPLTFRGYRRKSGPDTITGLRATPVVLTEDGQTGVAMRHFWQNAPKALEAAGDGFVLRLFPGQFADLHEIQGGEQKTHVFHVAFGDDLISPVPLDWARRPVLAAAPPAWYCAAGAVPYLTPASDDPNAAYLDLVNSVIDGPNSFEARRELIDEYGWRNFGDIYADHEAPFYKGAQPIVSHYNNQYDAIAGFAYQFLRTRDSRWWEAMSELATHVRDIDIYHTSLDRPLYSGGLLWHTFHYVDAGRSTHRCYPAAAGVPGGGPANEHAYSTGFMLHYFLTGEAASREAAIGLAAWVLQLDNGRGTPFWWFAHTDTGFASKTHSMDYHGPGRGAGNAIVVLLNGYRLTGRAEFLEKAEGLIRRCIHPQDDVEARGLADPESRWSYTVFLQALGRYLDEKILRGETDERYAYAQESLLNYARWMRTNEYLYLEKPKLLEYPTETWAAQDMRKSEVFKFAARHSSEAESETFLERSEYFFARSLETLMERTTRFFARPRVVLMSCGFMHAAFAHGVSPAPRQTSEGCDYGKPVVFNPQKQVAIRRAIVTAVLGACVVAGAAVAFLL